MRAGNLDRVIVIEAATVTYDEYRTPVASWAPVVSLRAQLIMRSLDDRQGQHAVTDSTATFRAYFYPGITLEHRVVFEGQTFKITAIKEIGRRVGLDIMCERVGQ
ncbi:head-tail adaptor protein [Nitrobacter sp.]|uniref:head-tail adaptor protein n=1 Tax=Nitrobacter sp. TaxID=29420 RepID=UPI003F653E26